ncbi:hypothetical protein E1301_Tti015683 [Triplophysa tibetana]|uniref:Uncharacterized protein n=1 Tax=Triplophysa tibetana TaxID=1572043 RepID=A0A5A9MYP7_9TELE|nr:hypothetical protein E1301_Tti015683 [Triplophysa tibetana]
MLSNPEREDIQQEAMCRTVSFITGGESEDETGTVLTVVAESEEWVNVPPSETADEVMQYISCNHYMKDYRISGSRLERKAQYRNHEQVDLCRRCRSEPPR